MSGWMLILFCFLPSVLLLPGIRQPVEEQLAASRLRTQKKLEQMFFYLPVEHLFTLQVGVAVACSLLALAFAWSSLGPANSLLPALAAGGLGFYSPHLAIAWVAARRRRLFSAQLVDALSLLSNGLRSSMTMLQSIEMLVEESPKPMCQEFSLVLREHRFGVNMEEALGNCSVRTGDQDLFLAAVAVKTTLQLGGNLAEVFERLVDMIKQRKILQEKADAMTAQGRMQAVMMAAMPYAFMFISSRMDPELTRIMFREPLGLLLLAVMVALDIIGYYWVLKICTIKY